MSSKRPKPPRFAVGARRGAWVAAHGAWEWYLDRTIRYLGGRRWQVRGKLVGPQQASLALLASILALLPYPPTIYRGRPQIRRTGVSWRVIGGATDIACSLAQMQALAFRGEELEGSESPTLTTSTWRTWQSAQRGALWFGWFKSVGKLLIQYSYLVQSMKDSDGRQDLEWYIMAGEYSLFDADIYSAYAYLANRLGGARKLSEVTLHSGEVFLRWQMGLKHETIRETKKRTQKT